MAGLLYPLGASMGFLILGLGFGPALRRMNISTIPEIFETIYNSKNLRIAASAISVVSLYLILVAQGIAAKAFLHSIGFKNSIWLITIWMLFVFYTTFGGLNAVVGTDIVQVLFILIGLTAALIFTNYSELSFKETVNFDMNLTSAQWSSWLLMPLCFTLIEQDMGQRCFAAKNPKIIVPAAIIASILLFLSSATSVFFGIAAAYIGIDSSAADSSILITVIGMLTNPIIGSIIICVIVAAIASTADSLICSISMHLAYDFPISQNLNEQKKLLISKLLTLCVGISALIFIYLFNDIVSVLMFSYGISVSAIFVPIVSAVGFRCNSKNGAYFSFIAGFSTFILLSALHYHSFKEFFSICISCIGYYAGAKLSNKRA